MSAKTDVVNSARRLLKPARRKYLIVIAAFALLGAVFLTQSRAATLIVALQAENGSKSGNQSPGLTDGASQGASVKFGGTGGPGTGNGAAGKRGIPIMMSGFLANATMSSKDYAAAQRFELDQPRTIDRWYFIINGKGANCDNPGDYGYGYGSGGIWNGRIVAVDQSTGLPTDTVLVSEKVAACTAQERSNSELGTSDTQIHWIQFQALALQPNTMYAFVLSNDDPDPGNGGEGSGNYMSINLNYNKDNAQLGPNGANTLNAQADGAVYGWTPREATMWSDDGGSNWKFGTQVATYNQGSGEGRLWSGGYRIAGGDSMAHGWPFMDWTDDLSGGASITYNDVPKAVTITKAGGSNDGSGDLGIITVTNTDTGQSSTTPSLGSGLQTGTLSSPVTVDVGQSYKISVSGRVGAGAADADLVTVYGLGTRAPWKYTKSSSDSSVPMLFVLPHPFTYN
jgi:hypothetical protein